LTASLPTASCRRAHNGLAAVGNRDGPGVRFGLWFGLVRKANYGGNFLCRIQTICAKRAYCAKPKSEAKSLFQSILPLSHGCSIFWRGSPYPRHAKFAETKILGAMRKKNCEGYPINNRACARRTAGGGCPYIHHSYFCCVALSFWYDALSVPLLCAIGNSVG